MAENRMVTDMRLRYIIFLAVLLIIRTAFSANYNTDSLYVEIEMNSTVSNGKFAPMWTSANRFGMNSNKNKNGYISAEVEYLSKLNYGWSMEAGAEVGCGVNNPSQVWLQQIYGDIIWKSIRLSIGSRERYGYPLDKNIYLTGGWMVEGPNARPIPQIRAEIDNYIDIPYTKGWTAFKGHIAYGMFIDNKWQREFVSKGVQFTQQTKYHSKSLMFRIGNKNRLPIEFEFGLLMATQFAGDLFLKENDGSSRLITDMPDNLGAYWAAFFPSAGGDDTPQGEQVNVEGNMLGSWNFALNYYCGSWKVRATLEHYFEDHSQMFWQYGRWKDGQLGIEVYLPKNKWISTVLWEGLSTKDSSGPVLYDGFLGSFPDIQWSCGDNYFNNYIYQAWQHFGQGMGHGMIPGPLYNENGQITFMSNRMKMHHVGIMGNPTEEWAWRILATYTRHWGTYDVPFDYVKKQFCGMIEVNFSPKSLKRWDFRLAGAIDRGQYPGNSIGGMINVRYKFKK